MSYQPTYQNVPHLKDIRRSLRSNATTAEKILWQYLRREQLGYKFRRQFSIGNFVVDFYCHVARLVIELDGWTHNSDRTKMKDVAKQEFLETKGHKVIRFTNEEMFGDIEPVLRKIKSICNERAVTVKPLSSPLPS